MSEPRHDGHIGFRTIPKTGLCLSELGFGGAPIAGLYRAVSADKAAATVQAAVDGGIRYFDTAPHYGLGLSEHRLGVALADRPRPDFAISTKVGRLLERNPTPTGSDLAAGGFDVADDLRRVFDFSRDGVRRSIGGSLSRLGTDQIDIAYVHDPDDQLDRVAAETIPALIELRDEGVVGSIGVGMNHWQALLQLVTRTDLDIVMVAGRWTLLDRSALPLLTACAAAGVAVAAAAPFNSGILAQDDLPADPTFDYRAPPPTILVAAQAIGRICRDFGVRLPHAALRFPLTHPAVVSVVAGMSTPSEAHDAVGAFKSTVPPDLFAEIDRYLGTDPALTDQP